MTCTFLNKSTCCSFCLDASAPPPEGAPARPHAGRASPEVPVVVFAKRLQDDGDQGHDGLHDAELQRGLGVGRAEDAGWGLRVRSQPSVLGTQGPGGLAGGPRHSPACRSAESRWSRSCPEGSRCRGSSWSWGAGVPEACPQRTPPEWPGCPPGCGGPTGSGQMLTGWAFPGSQP